MTIKNNLAIYQEGESTKNTILFIHGFPYDHFLWNNQTAFLKNYFRCVSYDIRGLGNSPAGDGQFTLEAFVDDVEIMMEEHNLEKPILCGISMGGYIALRAAERLEHKLGGLILCDTKPEADTNEVKLRRAAGVKKINSMGVKKFVAEFVPTCFTEESINSSTEYSEMLSRSLNSDPAGVKGCLLAMAGRTDTSGYLEKIKIPALVICGEHDKLSPPDAMREMAKMIKNSEFVLVPNAAHMSPVENPEFVNKAIKNFFDKNLNKL